MSQNQESNTFQKEPVSLAILELYVDLVKQDTLATLSTSVRAVLQLELILQY